MTETEGTMRPDGCVSDGTLLLHTDGALSEAESEAVGIHLDGCAVCRSRLLRMEARAESVRGWIERHDPALPDREVYDIATRDAADVDVEARRVAGDTPEVTDIEVESARTGTQARRWILALAASLVLAIGAASGMLFDGARSAWRALTGEPARVETVTTAEPTAATSFAPGGAELLIAFETPGAPESVTIERSADANVTLRVADGGVELLVDARSVRVMGGAPVAGAFTLLVPPTVRTVRLRVPGAPDRVVAVADLRAPMTVPLGGDG